jgi:hypothetical protein
MYEKNNKFKSVVLDMYLIGDILDKWNNTGFLTGLSDSDKLTVSKAYEMAYQILAANDDEQPANVVVFAVIRRLLTGTSERFDKLPEDFIFSALDIKQLIHMVNNVFAAQELIFKDIPQNLIDREAELTKFVSELYATLQHSINNNN